MKLSVQNGSLDKFTPVDVKSMDEFVNIIKNKTYSLGTFKGQKRNINNFEQATYVGLDFDGGYSLEQAIKEFSGYWHVIGTTRSHQKPKGNSPAQDRFRVILKLESPVNDPKDFKTTIMSLLEKYPQADSQCSDASRMFYECKAIVSQKDGGALVPIKKWVKKETKTQKVVSLSKGELSKKTLSFIAFGASANWNPRLFESAVDCHEQGYSKEETINLLLPATRDFQGKFDDLDLKTIDSAFAREPRHPKRGLGSVFNFKKASDTMKAEENVNWLVDGLLIEGGLSIFAGAPKSGKSTLTRQLATAVAQGGYFLERKVEQGPVLYLALEESEALVGKQFKHIGLKDSDPVAIHVGPVAPGNINEQLEREIEGFKAKLVVVDTLLLLANFQNANDYNEGYKVLSAYRDIARRTGAHIMCLHHQNKGEDRGANSILGSTAIQGAVDASIIMNTMKGREAYRLISSYQRGGKRFINEELEYFSELDLYKLRGKNSANFF